MQEQNLDIICIQESFSYGRKVKGYKSPNLVKNQPQSGENTWVAAVVNKDVLLNIGNEN